MKSTIDYMTHYRARRIAEEYGMVLTDLVTGEAYLVRKAAGSAHLVDWFKAVPLMEQVTTFWPLISGQVH